MLAFAELSLTVMILTIMYRTGGGLPTRLTVRGATPSSTSLYFSEQGPTLLTGPHFSIPDHSPVIV